jgi:hypothetical protein
MVGGVKAIYAVLLALVLIVGGAKVLSGQNATDGTSFPPDEIGPDHGHSHSHHVHYQPPPLLEMLPPIGPIGIVAIGVVSDLNFSSRESALPWDPARSDHDGHRHEGEGGPVDHNSS